MFWLAGSALIIWMARSQRSSLVKDFTIGIERRVKSRLKRKQGFTARWERNAWELVGFQKLRWWNDYWVVKRLYDVFHSFKSRIKADITVRRRSVLRSHVFTRLVKNLYQIMCKGHMLVRNSKFMMWHMSWQELQ